MPASIRVAFGLIVLPLSCPGLRRFNGGGIHDVDPPFAHDDVLRLQWAVDLAEQATPDILLNPLRAKPPERGGLWYIKFEVTKLSKQPIPIQALRSLYIRELIPDAQ